MNISALMVVSVPACPIVQKLALGCPAAPCSSPTRVHDVSPVIACGPHTQPHRSNSILHSHLCITTTSPNHLSCTWCAQALPLLA